MVSNNDMSGMMQFQCLLKLEFYSWFIGRAVSCDCTSVRLPAIKLGKRRDTLAKILSEMPECWHARKSGNPLLEGCQRDMVDLILRTGTTILTGS